MDCYLVSKLFIIVSLSIIIIRTNLFVIYLRRINMLPREVNIQKCSRVDIDAKIYKIKRETYITFRKYSI